MQGLSADSSRCGVHEKHLSTVSCFGTEITFDPDVPRPSQEGERPEANNAPVRCDKKSRRYWQGVGDEAFTRLLDAMK